MTTLSIDIGHTYLAYAVSDGAIINYGIHFISPTGVLNRIDDIIDFLYRMKFDYLVVEKQMGTNSKCMQLMYAIASAARCKGSQVEIQHAVTKFHTFNRQCISDNKAHKRLSVQMALESLQDFDDISPVKLFEYAKQDDIADAINMLRASIFNRNIPTSCMSSPEI
jgi:hypothetical protein